MRYRKKTYIVYIDDISVWYVRVICVECMCVFECDSHKEQSTLRETPGRGLSIMSLRLILFDYVWWNSNPKTRYLGTLESGIQTNSYSYRQLSICHCCLVNQCGAVTFGHPYIHSSFISPSSSMRREIYVNTQYTVKPIKTESSFFSSNPILLEKLVLEKFDLNF